MKKNLLIWGTALILVIVAFYVTKNYSNAKSAGTVNQTQSTQSSSSQSLNTADTTSDNKAIDFTLTDLDGKKVSLKDFRGKNVYLNFWATWCPPCRGEMPEIEKVYQQYKDKDFVVLAVDLGEDKNTVQNFIKQNNYNFKVLLDSDQSVATKYNITAIPVSYFIDKDGNVVTKRVGALSEEEMQSYVKQLVGK
ncbi:MAG: TlpA disulfide reductase family protein [Clostridiales bacterium]|nr:TlpA family protein disulfide reductase [Eubacteriales bacterium]MDH7567837.1 TlpA disulfide reductase family protein [Clostridiales bacterium]